MTDNRLVAYILVVAVLFGLTFGAGIAVDKATTTTKETVKVKVVYADHPKGLKKLARFSGDEDLGVVVKKCVVWANFDPNPNTAFVVGQRFISDCTIVKKGPVG